MTDEDEILPPRKKSLRPILFGFGITSVFFVLLYAEPAGELGRAANYFVLNVFFSFIAIILAVIPVTRRFGLGMLLACGLVWLIVAAMCGGMLGR